MDETIYGPNAVKGKLPKQGLNAHRMIAETAVEMANELFEVYAVENKVYAAMRADGHVSEKQARRQFVLRVAPRLLEDARDNLTSLLAVSDDVVSAHMKQRIYEALIADNDLRANRQVSAASAAVPKHLH